MQLARSDGVRRAHGPREVVVDGRVGDVCQAVGPGVPGGGGGGDLVPERRAEGLEGDDGARGARPRVGRRPQDGPAVGVPEQDDGRPRDAVDERRRRGPRRRLLERRVVGEVVARREEPVDQVALVPAPEEVVGPPGPAVRLVEPVLDTPPLISTKGYLYR